MENTTGTAGKINSHEFFRLNATYQAAPGATSEQLMDDATMLMGVVQSSLTALAMSIDVAGDGGDITNERGFCQLLWGLSYLAEMGNKAAGAAQSMSLAEQRTKLAIAKSTGVAA